jgi:hypothetical protein
MTLIKAIKEGEDLRLDPGSHIFVDTAQACPERSRRTVTDSIVGSPVLCSFSVFET